MAVCWLLPTNVYVRPQPMSLGWRLAFLLRFQLHFAKLENAKLSIVFSRLNSCPEASITSFASSLRGEASNKGRLVIWQRLILCPGVYYRFQNIRAVTVFWITFDRNKIARCGFHHSRAKTQTHQSTLKSDWLANDQSDAFSMDMFCTIFWRLL